MSVIEVAVGVLSVTTMVAALAGMAVRFALLPWLREHLVAPLEETHHQVTVNSHVSPEPTVLDRIDTLADELHLMARMFDGHIESSAADRARLWAAVDRPRRLFGHRTYLDQRHRENP